MEDGDEVSLVFELQNWVHLKSHSLPELEIGLGIRKPISLPQALLTCTELGPRSPKLFVKKESGLDPNIY